MIHPRPRLFGRLQLLAAAALFSTGGAEIKATTLTGWQVAGYRSGVAALAILIFAPAARRGWSWRVVLVGVAYAATVTLFVVANKLTMAANTIFLQSSAPLYILLLGPLLLQERVRRDDLLLIGIVGVGLALFFVGTETPMETAPDPARGNLLGALSGITWALTLTGLRWLATRPSETGAEAGDEALATVAVGNLIACLAALPFAFPATGATAMDWGAILYLGVFQIAVAYLLLTRGIQQVSALEASLLLLIEPALNPVWAWALHGELPSAWAVGGGCLILGASVLRSWVGVRRVA